MNDMKTLTISQARCMALAAQGFAIPRPTGSAGVRQISGVLDKIGLLQIDSVNVVARSHYLPLFSRLGPYDRELLHKMARRPHRIVEYWAHEASYIPVETRRLLQWRMEDWRQHAWREVRQVAEARPELLEAVLGALQAKGPLTPQQIEHELQDDALASKENWGWNWSDARVAVEALFWSGEIMATERTSQFQRIYDLSERVLSTTRLLPVPRTEAIRKLVTIAAKAQGVATAGSLRDYFRLSASQTTEAIETLVADGTLVLVQVEGWQKAAYMYAKARVPRHIAARALLSPFDSLVFDRTRLQMLFDFDYKLEIYTPQAKRKYGYYVLPFLLGERIVARVDVKADRTRGILLVRSAFAEADAPDSTSTELAQELQAMAAWLDLKKILVEPKGDLSTGLATAMLALG
jgi:uncharacterized protein YcaQ